MKLALLCAAALFQSGCAYYFSGSYEQKGTQSAQARAVEPDARLECDGSPCSQVPLVRDRFEGHSSAGFWVIEGLQLGLTAVPFVKSASKGGGDPGAVSILLLFAIPAGIDLALGLFGYATGRFGDSEGSWRLGNHFVVGDYKGTRIPVTLADVLPDGAKQPDSFSLAHVAELRGIQLAGDMVKKAKKRVGGSGDLAVLDFDGGKLGADGETMRQLVDAVRGSLSGTSDFKVITREKIFERCPPDTCGWATDVEAGRRLHATALLTLTPAHLGSRYLLSLKATETGTGREAVASATSSSLRDLDRKLVDAANELLEQFAPPGTEMAALPAGDLPAARPAAVSAVKARADVAISVAALTGSLPASDLQALSAAAREALQGAPGVRAVESGGEAVVSGQALKVGSTMRVLLQLKNAGAEEGQSAQAAGKSLDELKDGIRAAVKKLLADARLGGT